jgi:valyl-tRNA synthetase
MKKQVDMIIHAHSEEVKNQLEKNRSYLERFCNPSSLTIDTNIEAPDKAMTAVVSGAEVFLPLEGLINVEEEIKRLEKELEKWNKEVERVQKKLANEGFIKKAPKEVVEEERAKEKDYLEKQQAVLKRLQELKG